MFWPDYIRNSSLCIDEVHLGFVSFHLSFNILEFVSLSRKLQQEVLHGFKFYTYAHIGVFNDL